MTRTSKIVQQFLLVISVVITLSFIAHALIQEKLGFGFYGKQIVNTYIFNYLLSVIVFLVIKVLSARHQSKIGFIFLYSSLSKFLLFYILILPGFGEINGVRSPEFVSFFVPYFLSTGLEIVYLTKLLNN